MSAGAKPSRRRARLAVVLIAGLFLAPALLALWLNTGGVGWVPFGHTNHGTLIDPARRVSLDRLRGLEPGSRASPVPHGRWVLLVVAAGPCRAACDAALYSTRQARLALGKDAPRVVRVLVLPPEAVEAPRPGVAEAHPDLMLAVSPAGWSADLPGAAPAVFVVDPRGYAMLRYAAAVGEGRGMIKDLERLLRISRIG